MKTRKIRGGLFGIETKKQMECLKNIIIVILSAEASYIKENSQANDSFFLNRLGKIHYPQKGFCCFDSKRIFSSPRKK